MRIHVKQVITGYDGTPLQQPNNSGAPEDYTIREAIVVALNNILPNEVLLAEDKARIFSITTKVYSKSEPDLTVDELAFIKDRAGKILMPVAYGRLLEMIDPKPVDDTPPKTEE